MLASKAKEPPSDPVNLLQPRQYQHELFQEARSRNVSGQSHSAFASLIEGTLSDCVLGLAGGRLP